MNQRILELALEELERQRAAIVSEIESIRAELRGVPGSTKKEPVNRPGVKSRSRTPEQKQAQSLKMKEIWAKRKAKAKPGSGRAGKKSTKE